MAVMTEKINVSTKGFTDILDITTQVREAVRKSKINSGIITLFIPGSTAAITTIEYEPGLIKDLPEMLEKVAPQKAHYHHDHTWQDGNGYAHLRSALLKTSLTIPFVKGELTLGTWQQVVFIDFDNRARRRQLIAQIIGE